MEELPNVDWRLVVRRTLKRELEEILELKRIILLYLYISTIFCVIFCVITEF